METPCHTVPAQRYFRVSSLISSLTPSFLRVSIPLYEFTDFTQVLEGRSALPTWLALEEVARHHCQATTTTNSVQSQLQTRRFLRNLLGNGRFTASMTLRTKKPKGISRSSSQSFGGGVSALEEGAYLVDSPCPTLCNGVVS